MARKRSLKEPFSKEIIKDYQPYDVDWLVYLAKKSYTFLNGRINPTIKSTELRIRRKEDKFEHTWFKQYVPMGGSSFGPIVTIYPGYINVLCKSIIRMGGEPISPIEMMSVVFGIVAHELSHVNQKITFKELNVDDPDIDNNTNFKFEQVNELHTIKWINDHLAEASKFMGFPIWPDAYEAISSYVAKNYDNGSKYSADDYVPWESPIEALMESLNGLFGLHDVDDLIRRASHFGATGIRFCTNSTQKHTSTAVVLGAPTDILKYEGTALMMYDMIHNNLRRVLNLTTIEFTDSGKDIYMDFIIIWDEYKRIDPRNRLVSMRYQPIYYKPNVDGTILKDYVIQDACHMLTE